MIMFSTMKLYHSIVKFFYTIFTLIPNCRNFNFDFSNIDHSICPSCLKKIKNFEKEIRVPAMWYQCEDCIEKFDNAVIKLHCRKYDHDFDTNSGKFITTFCYKLKNSDISNISDTN